ncbi:MAG: nitroreductase A [Methanomassiliicoccales archaeon PtaB.Bin134]|jgi:nitroreductase|nr:MAG: nitroreductase A [Methanomassiliicoccales archaeon PtaB.Bin134]
METLEAINTRRSVRRYLDTPVEKEKIQTLLEAAIRAPSAMNKQCWRFVAITDKETIAGLAKCQVMINGWIKDVPAVIVVCADPKDSADQNGLPYYMWDAALAMHNLVLAATDAGLGTCYLAAYKEDKVKELLGIPENYRVLCMTPLGYPTEKRSIGEKLMKAVAGSSKRKPVEEVAHWERW